MPAKLKVTYLDDTEIEVIATPRAQVMTERFLKGYTEVTMVEAGYRLAYESLASRKQLSNGIGYEEWLDTIADVEELEAEPTPDPTPEAASPTASSD
jgi:hypothetical protein